MDSDNRRVDPLPLTVSLLASVKGTLQSTKALYETVNRFKGRDRTLKRLQDELEGLQYILASVTQMTNAENSMLSFAQDPIRRCSQLCHKFEESMNLFAQESRLRFRDWMKMEFMGTDIHGFIDTVEEYKSTIAISLGMVTMLTSQEYTELIQTTSHNLEIHLQRIDEKLGGVAINDIDASLVNIDLNLRRESALQCLRICQDAKSHIRSLADRALAWNPDRAASNRVPNHLTAQLRGSQTPNTDSLLPKNLQPQLSGSNSPDLPLQKFKNPPKLNISRKTFRIDEAVADCSDQVAVTTYVPNQLVGSSRMTEDELQKRVKAHYKQ